jgi:predicted glycogen debranching enzyme
MEDLVVSLPPPGQAREAVLSREWLATNGLGGYASGTIGGMDTRRYHGLLIAALPAPLGRWVMLNYLEESLEFALRECRTPRGQKASRAPGGSQPSGPLRATGLYIDMDSHKTGQGPGRAAGALEDFRLQWGLPVWRFRVENRCVLEKRLVLPHLQNTVIVAYRLLEGDSLTLHLRPWVHFRPQNQPVGPLEHTDYHWQHVERGHELSLPSSDAKKPLRLKIDPAGRFDFAPRKRQDLIYPAEEERGYSSKGEAWSPGEYQVALFADTPVAFLASTEDWEVMTGLAPRRAFDSEVLRRREMLESAHESAREGPAGLLVLAADQFLISPAGRRADEARAHAVGDEVRSVIAGYHWFGDWGRDSMISLAGCTLMTGRPLDATYILRTFGQYMRDGLIPNLFPEGDRQGQYNTADATLWFFHALRRYLLATRERFTFQRLLPILTDCILKHLEGTKFNIRVDPEDGLLSQGEEGLQLTWMDAKVGDWVVTPRRGKAVEINALWYNALCLLSSWLEKSDPAAAREMAGHARKAKRSFNRRFWYAQGGYLYDVIDGPNGDDPSCRPNQILAFALRHPVLHRKHWGPVLQVVHEKLLTPRGLRTLTPDDPDFKPQYFGDRRHRDAAYHQGTVWPWLIGPFVDAWLLAHPGDEPTARTFVAGVLESLSEGCIGSINEIFDAEPPYTPRGCVAQAWSVAEVLRAWVRTARQGGARTPRIDGSHPIHG